MIIVQERERLAALASPLPSTFDYHSRVETNQVYFLIDKNQSALTCYEWVSG